MTDAHRRILLAEEGLRSLRGHWWTYNSAIARAFAARGWETQIAGAADVSADLADVAPVFSESRWDASYDAMPPMRRRLWTLRHNLRLARDMGRYLDGGQSWDIVFAGNVTLAHALGWWRVLRRHRDRIRHLALMFVQDAGHYPEGASEPVFPSQARLLRAFIRLFRGDVARGRVVLTCETEVTRRQYERLTGLPFHLLNHPVELPHLNAPRESPPLLVAPGFARYEKGSDLLQDAWLRFRAARPDLPAKLVMQWDRDFGLPAGRTETTRLRALPEVTYISDSLDDESLARLFARASGVIAPYRRTSYYSRLSRVTIEAMQAGLPVLHTADTWLAGAVEAHGAGMAVPGDNPEALARALPRFIEALPTLLPQAATRAQGAVNAFSPATFASKLAQLCGLVSD